MIGMNSTRRSVLWISLASVALAATLFGASPASAQISLGTAESFGVLAGSAVTNTGPSVVTGNLGVSPGSAVTGFPPGIVTPPGTIHSADAVARRRRPISPPHTIADRRPRRPRSI